MTLYEQIAQQISEMIHTGVLKESEKLPSLRKSGQIYGVSPATVQQAYFLLETQGVIYAKERSGFYINPIFKTGEVLDELDSPASQHSQEKLGIDDTESPLRSPWSFLACENTQIETLSSADVVNRETGQNASGNQLIFSILAANQDPLLIPFGAAFASSKLFPMNHLTDSMAKALAGFADRFETLGLDSASGSKELARQIELRYRLNGLKVQRQELVITSGAMEALSLSLQATTQPGDYVAIESPCFYAVLQILERLQLKAVEIPVTDRGMDVASLGAALQSQAIKAIVVMTKYHNPTGSTMLEADLAELYHIVKKHQVPIIVDDAYSELYFGTELPAYLKSLDEEGLVLHCDSFCKSLAPGFRVGWVAAGRYAQQIEHLKLMTTVSPSVPSQLAISHYLKHRNYDRHLTRLRAELQRSQAKMMAAIAQYFPKEVRVAAPIGGYFLWVELPAEVDGLALYHRALTRNISIMPGALFSKSKKFNHCIRLNYGMVWSAELESAMAILGELIVELMAH